MCWRVRTLRTHAPVYTQSIRLRASSIQREGNTICCGSAGLDGEIEHTPSHLLLQFIRAPPACQQPNGYRYCAYPTTPYVRVMARSAKKRTIAQRRVTAYHEAGHAVAAWALGYQVECVTIAPGDSHNGQTEHANPLRSMPAEISPEWTNPDSQDGAIMTHLIGHDIIIAFAGPLAQKRHNPKSHFHVGAGRRVGKLVSEGSDYQHVLNLISRIYGNGKVADTYRKHLEARAKDLVEKQWPEIERLAQALIERETIASQEILAILNADAPAIITAASCASSPAS